MESDEELVADYMFELMEMMSRRKNDCKNIMNDNNNQGGSGTSPLLPVVRKAEPCSILPDGQCPPTATSERGEVARRKKKTGSEGRCSINEFFNPEKKSSKGGEI